MGKKKKTGVVKPVNIKHHVLEKDDDVVQNRFSVKKLTLHEQRLSNEHQEELQSLVLVGSLAAIGIVYFLK